MSFTESLSRIVGENKSGLLSTHPSWERVPLGEVCEILNGFPFPSEGFNAKVGQPVLRIRDVLRGETETRFEGNFDPQYIVRPGDLVVGMDGDFNCALWRGAPALLNQRVCKVSPRRRHYSRRFLVHILQGYLKAINDHTPSLTVKHLSSKTLAEVPLPLPPLEEQVRVAAALESCFTRLDNAEATLERVKRNLERYRASLLQAAVEGRLVPTEAQLAHEGCRDFEPASEILRRMASARKGTQRERSGDAATVAGAGLPELPKGWAWTTLDAVADITGGLTKGKHRRAGEVLVEVPYLRVANVQRGHLELGEMKTIPATAEEIAELRLQPGDVLFNEGGDRDKLGRGWVWDGQIHECIHQNHVFRARLFTKDLLPKFLSWYSNTKGQAYFFREGKHTTNLASINSTKLRGLPVPVPPRAEQERIVATVEERLTILDEAARCVAIAEARTSRLRQSTLTWAFTGRLVDQNSSDEPASVLLKRIHTERSKVTSSSEARRHWRGPRKAVKQ